MQYLKRIFSTSFLLAGLTVFSVAIAQDLSDQVIIRRTEYGVPHIKADNVRAAGYAMGYLQLEDYGKKIVEGLVKASGKWAFNNELTGRELEIEIDRDASSIRRYKIAVETFPSLQKETQELLKGYAEGVNRYIEVHSEEFPDWVKPNFTEYDVHAKGIGSHNNSSVKEFIRRQRNTPELPEQDEVSQSETPIIWKQLAMHTEDIHPEVGSNTWALSPSRTTSGKAILMRNPHLSWGAGYYEAQMEVAGKFNFYGDFRIGEPLGIVGGFNEHLGWSTTNNDPDIDEIYAFKIDPEKADHYILDGVSNQLLKEEVLVYYKIDQGIGEAKREFLSTPFGPVVHRDEQNIYIIRSAGDGEYRTNEQFLKMMMARNLEEWKDAMRIRAKTNSNFTYADKEGTIYYVWNGSVPDISHVSGGDTAAVFVSKSSEIWKDLVVWDDLPQLKNPKGGYLHNENDPFHYTNLNEVFNEADFPAHFSKPQLRLRSQLSLDLIANEDILSLEDVVERKNSMKALLADRVKEDLIKAVRKSNMSSETAEALALLSKWDNTVAATSKGGILFMTWWEHYLALSNNGKRVKATPESAGYAAHPDSLFVEPWSPKQPTTTPRGLASPNRAAEAFEWAIQECKKRYRAWDLAWGDVHRARIGSQDVPMGGASGDLGCFRVIWYAQHKHDKQKREVQGGDGWVIAIEFGETPRAYSVLAYGESIKENSPYFGDQLELFATEKMKRVAYTEQDILKQIIKEYRPGKE